MQKRNIPFFRPDITESEVIAPGEVVASRWLTTGAVSAEFEREIARRVGCSHAVAVSSNTAGLGLVLKKLGITAGDEIITTPYTYTATAAVALATGAKVLFADITPGTYHIDPQEVARLLSPRTKAVISVDIGGVSADKAGLYEVLKKGGSFAAGSPLQEVLGRPALISDAAHSFGTPGCGADADFSVFSFHAVKNLTTAEGGAITWHLPAEIKGEAFSRELIRLRLHGVSHDAFQKEQGWNWEYDVEEFGEKCNLPDVLASIGLSQLRRFDAMLEKRRTLYEAYRAALPGTELLRHDRVPSNWHLLMTQTPTLTEERRRRVIARMAEEYGVQANVHFKPLPLMTAYRSAGYRMEEMPVAYARYCGEVTLPLYASMTEEDVHYAAESFCKAVTEEGTRRG